MDEVALSFQVLGPIRAQLGDRPLDLGGPKQRAVLAAMLLETGHVVSTDRLSDAAWGDHPPLNALAGLQVYISNLRRILRDRSLSSSPIVRRNPGYLIDVPPEAIDTGRFVAGCARTRQLVEAARWHEATVEADRTLGLWHGPLAQEFADQDWVGVAAPPFEERRLTCRQDLITSLLGEQRAAEALNRASVLAREHPLDEKACWLYALTLHQLGRTADALAGLAAFAQTLDDELGLRPGPALRDLQGSILRLDPSLETWPNSPSRTVPGVVEPPSPTVAPQAAGDRRPDPSTLIGRQAELGAIEAAWRGLERGACVWVLVTGPAGIGKSRIVGESILRQTREISGALPSSPRVLRVTCPDDAALPAWWPVRQLLKGLGVDPDAVLGSSEGTDTEVTRFAVYERVTDQVRRAAADSALVIVVDDVHWADFSTVTLLAHFAETVHVPGTAWLLTARDEIDHIDDGRLVSALARRTDAVRVRLPPLDPDEVSELVTQISGETLEPSEVTAVVERTGGNAFFVT